MRSFSTVDSREGVAAQDLAAAVDGLDRPVVFRNAVAGWPLVEAARRSAGDLIDYLKACDSGQPAPTFRQADGDGHFFYGNNGPKVDLGGFNFQRADVPLSLTLERLRGLAAGGRERIYIQSAPLKDHLPRARAENTLPVIEAEPRIWIGNASSTRLHFDLYDNLACMVAGTKRFILIPPGQTGNLYIGPIETTVSGVPVAMADPENPDLAAHPRFAEALDVASEAVLEPGDVLFIPYMWWHHVVSSQALNVQVNYWWNPARTGLGQAMQALILAMLNVRDLPPQQRDAWRAMFEALVFAGPGVADHLPEGSRGILGDLTPEQRAAIRQQLGMNLSEA